MKRFIWILVIILFGCNTEELDIPEAGEKGDFILQVPEEFSWSAIVQDVLLVTITSEGQKSSLLDSTRLELYDENDRMLDALTVEKGTACFNLRIPTGMKNLKIKAPAVNLSLECNASRRSLNFEVPSSEKYSFSRSDHDRDGLYDEFDQAPFDENVTIQTGPFYSQLKSTEANSHGLNTFFIFEDSWPLKGDFDYNDAVVSISFSWSRGRDNYIREIHGQYKIHKNAADLGIGIELFEARGAYLIYMDEVVAILDGDVVKNREAENLFEIPEVDGESSGLEGSFNLKIVDRKLKDFVFIPYLYRHNNPHQQIRSFGTPPTLIQDMNLFKTGDDNSPMQWKWNKGNKFKYPLHRDEAFYQTRERYPWGISFIADEFSPSPEGQVISESYPGFREWVESGGNKSSSWFQNPR